MLAARSRLSVQVDPTKEGHVLTACRLGVPRPEQPVRAEARVLSKNRSAFACAVGRPTIDDPPITKAPSSPSRPAKRGSACCSCGSQRQPLPEQPDPTLSVLTRRKAPLQGHKYDPHPPSRGWSGRSRRRRCGRGEARSSPSPRSECAPRDARWGQPHDARRTASPSCPPAIITLVCPASTTTVAV